MRDIFKEVYITNKQLEVFYDRLEFMYGLRQGIEYSTSEEKAANEAILNLLEEFMDIIAKEVYKREQISNNTN